MVVRFEAEEFRRVGGAICSQGPMRRASAEGAQLHLRQFGGFACSRVGGCRTVGACREGLGAVFGL